MKYLKRSDCLRQTRKAIMDYHLDKSEAKLIEKQINQAWERKEQEEKEKIQMEVDCAWKEHALTNDNDSWDEDDIIKVEEYVEYENDAIESEESEYLCQKSRKRSARRKASKHAQKRLIMKSKIAAKNSRKRYEEDLKNLQYHSSKEIKSRVARCNTLEKKANRLQH